MREDGKYNCDNVVRDLASLVSTDTPEAVISEARDIITSVYPSIDLSLVEKGFADILRLYNGQYPGYQECKISYHDLRHTMDVFLAMARYLHGAKVLGMEISQDYALLGLFGAVMHDAGYIQEDADVQGTGAKYTTTHVDRSMEFVRNYDHGLSDEQVESCARIISATDLAKPIGDIQSATEQESFVGKGLYAADIMGQMADRYYLEKLLYLYLEFHEAGGLGFTSEEDLMRKTNGFYQFVWGRLTKDAQYKESVMAAHFKSRWNINEDLYTHAVRRNLAYLTCVLDRFGSAYRLGLSRGGLVRKLEEARG
jgi:hypothetical protein